MGSDGDSRPPLKRGVQAPPPGLVENWWTRHVPRFDIRQLFGQYLEYATVGIPTNDHNFR